MSFGEVVGYSLTDVDTTPQAGHAAAVSSAVTTCTTRVPSARCSTRATRTPGSPNNNVVPSVTALGFLLPSESVATFRLRKAKGLPTQRHALRERHHNCPFKIQEPPNDPTRATGPTIWSALRFSRRQPGQDLNGELP